MDAFWIIEVETPIISINRKNVHPQSQKFGGIRSGYIKHPLSTGFKMRWSVRSIELLANCGYWFVILICKDKLQQVEDLMSLYMIWYLRQYGSTADPILHSLAACTNAEIHSCYNLIQITRDLNGMVVCRPGPGEGQAGQRTSALGSRGDLLECT